MKAVEGPIVEAMTGGDSTEADHIISNFKGEGILYDEFMFFVADIFIAFVQYGQRTDLCAKMENAKDLSGGDLVNFVAAEVYTGGIDNYKTSVLRETEIKEKSNMRQWTW